MPRYAYNKSSRAVKQKYFELIRSGVRGAEAARRVGVSMSCGSLWFIDAGSVHIIEKRPVSSRFLSQEDRIEIADGLSAGLPVKLIAERIGKSFQTVYREIARNRKLDGTYQPWYAHNQAHVRRRRPKPRRLDTDPQLRGLVTDKLQQLWSPEQTCRWLRRRYPRHQDWHLSWETVYDGLYRGLLGAGRAADLRTGRKFRHRRGRGRNSFPRMPAMRSIHQRPRHIESRRQAGHWEGDLIVGALSQSAVATLVERKTRFTILVALPDGHKAPQTASALSDALNILPAHLRRTLTWDQGFEMYCHPAIEAKTGTAIYFADPHSPWQRGTNENTNKLLRQYLPKSTNLRQWSQKDLDAIAAELNDRPRKCLNDRTPAQLMVQSRRRKN